jgi:hypothetical protein
MDRAITIDHDCSPRLTPVLDPVTWLWHLTDHMTKKRKAKTIEDYIDLARSEQAYCSTCQPYDSGECIWIRGIQQSMEDFLGDLGIPDKYRGEVAASLSCSHCGAGLDITCDVGTKTDDERREDELWDSWHQNYEWRLKEFAEHLEKYPYLGLMHPLGKEISDDIEKLPRSSITKPSWFRGRRVDDSRVLEPMDMFPPDPNLVAIPEGRYNHFGQCAFYLSETKEGAAREVLGKDGGLAWVQEFALCEISDIANLSKHDFDAPEEDISVLAFGLSYTNVLAHPVERAAGWKPEYFVPRFIADCLKKVGFKGIIFRSPHHYSDNLVLFSYPEKDVKTVNAPSIIPLKKEEKSDFYNPLADFPSL